MALCDTTFLTEDSWGVASLRQCAGYVSNGTYYAPLSNCLVKWDIKSKQCEQLHLHSDLITNLILSNNNVILSVGFSGEVRLWDNEYKLLAHFQSLTNNIVYGSWSDDSKEFSICSKGPRQMVVVYNLEKVLSQFTPKVCMADHKWFHKAPQSEIAKSKQNDNIKEQQLSYDCFNAALFKHNKEVITVYQTSKLCELYLFSGTGEFLKKSLVSPLGEDKSVMLCVRGNLKRNMLAIGLQHGIFGFYDTESLQMLAVIQATGSPQICHWHNDMFITMSYQSGILSYWTTNGILLKEITGGPSGSVIQMNGIDESSFYIGGIMSLHHITVNKDDNKMTRNYDLSFLSLTGCGLSLSKDQIIASGDFSGKVFLWEHKKRLPVTQFTLPSLLPVRCLLWVKNVLLIGSLSGELFSWQKNESIISNNDIKDSNIKDIDMLYHFVDGVVVLQLNKTENRFAVGTTGGCLYVFDIKESVDCGLEIMEVWNSQVHESKYQNDGLLLKMEIWSLMWSVDDELIATTSEDQTTVISNANTGKKIATLTGHTTAVTAVDWKILASGKNVLVTCADDRTVRIYDGVTFDLMRVLNTYDIYGWHTLTYLCLCRKKQLLIVSTQHGYLVVWDLKNESYKCIAQWKMHSGSVEGLLLSPNESSIYTIGSDCVVNRFSLANF